MKIATNLLLFSIPASSAFSVSFPLPRVSTKLDAAVYYDTQTGNTEKCAEYIAEAAGIKAEFIGKCTKTSVPTAPAGLLIS